MTIAYELVLCTVDMIDVIVPGVLEANQSRPLNCTSAIFLMSFVANTFLSDVEAVFWVYANTRVLFFFLFV